MINHRAAGVFGTGAKWARETTTTGIAESPMMELDRLFLVASEKILPCAQIFLDYGSEKTVEA